MVGCSFGGVLQIILIPAIALHLTPVFVSRGGPRLEIQLNLALMQIKS